LPETGFFREYFVTGEDMGKNPVSLIVRGRPETGFLREYFVTGEERSIANASILLLGFRRCSIR
jgi:hypothetical protein